MQVPASLDTTDASQSQSSLVTKQIARGAGSSAFHHAVLFLTKRHSHSFTLFTYTPSAYSSIENVVCFRFVCFGWAGLSSSVCSLVWLAYAFVNARVKGSLDARHGTSWANPQDRMGRGPNWHLDKHFDRFHVRRQVSFPLFSRRIAKS
jgi:hypothetical protein